MNAGASSLAVPAKKKTNKAAAGVYSQLNQHIFYYFHKLMFKLKSVS